MTRKIILLLAAVFPAVSSAALIQETDLTYLGAFRVPQGTYNGTSYEYGGYALCYYPTNNSLFIASINGQEVAEFTIPTLSTSSNINDLSIATNLQGFADITEGNRANIGLGGSHCSPSGVFLGGLLPYGDVLVGTLWGYYDGEYCAELSHFTSGLDFSATGDFEGVYRVGDNSVNVGFRAMYMAEIPEEWRSSFGGAPAVTGRAFLPIITRSSFGPSLWTFDPDSLGVVEPVPSTPLVYYEDTGSRATFGEYAGSSPANEYVSPRDLIGGVVWPPGTDTVLFIGMHGSGDWCYKCDPPNNPDGNGSWPYHYWAWAYDANDFAASYSGTYEVTQDDSIAGRFIEGIYPNNTALAVGDTVRPWNVKPYDMWEFTVPIAPENNRDVYGATYDPATNRLYFSAMRGDGARPIIHAYEISISASEEIAVTSASVAGGLLTLEWTDTSGATEWQIQAAIDGSACYSMLASASSVSFPVTTGTIAIKITNNLSGYVRGGASN